MGIIDRLDQIKNVNGVPFVIWCYWAGGPMNENRLLSLETLVKNIQVPVFLINKKNLYKIQLSEHPFHPAFPYLSAVHQSDYIRIYLLHFYGGGWHDIKATEVSYKEVWPEFRNPTIYLIGRQERIGGPATVFDEENRWMPDYWADLISVTSWIGRPNTELSQAMLNGINKLLDINLDLLKKYPAKHPREKKIVKKDIIANYLTWTKNALTGRSNHYPLPWTVFGNIFHPLNYKFKDHISFTLPKDKIKNAGIYHR